VDQATPDDLVAPEGLGDTENSWRVLADLFVRDIKGEAVASYPTFATGAHYQQIIDIIRRGDNWTAAPKREGET
jgi:hypothetical protein